MSKAATATVSNDIHEQLVSLKPNEILVDESKNLRRYTPNQKNIESLSRDIVERGQLQPVVVALNGDGEYRLVAGFRRYRAIALANENGAGLPILARVVHVDEKQAMLDNLAENIQRENLSPVDMAQAIKVMRENEMTIKDVSKAFGKSEAWTRNIESMLSLSPEKQKLVHSGTIPYTIARYLVNLSEEEQDELIGVYEKAVQAGENGQAAVIGARAAKKGKQAGGRKSKGEEKAGKTGLSAKRAIVELETVVEESKNEEGRKSKAEQGAIAVCHLIVKYLAGRMGVQALHKKLVEELA